MRDGAFPADKTDDSQPVSYTHLQTVYGITVQADHQPEVLLITGALEFIHPGSSEGSLIHQHPVRTEPADADIGIIAE